MKKLFVAVTLWAMIGLVLADAAANAGTRFGKLKGHVINSGNVAPIQNLTIEVIGQGQTKTDQNGKYAFDNLPVGSYGNH